MLAESRDQKAGEDLMNLAAATNFNLPGVYIRSRPKKIATNGKKSRLSENDNSRNTNTDFVSILRYTINENGGKLPSNFKKIWANLFRDWHNI